MASHPTAQTHVNFLVPRLDQDDPRIAFISAHVASPALSELETFVNTLRLGLTQWATQRDEGRNAWSRSSHDFNVGDLDHLQSLPSLIHHLQKVGITQLTVELAPHLIDLNTWHYDTVLIDPQMEMPSSPHSVPITAPSRAS